MSTERTSLTTTEKARAYLFIENGRATAAALLLANALQTLEEARRVDALTIPDVAVERLRRLALEASAKIFEFRREIDELIANQ